MKVRCPACGATYDVDQSRLPAEGRTARCTRCRTRFLIKFQGKRPNIDLDWKTSKYDKIYSLVDRYYRSRSEDFRFALAALCVAHRDLPGGKYVRAEVRRLKQKANELEKAVLEAEAESSRADVEIMEAEARRCTDMIQAFRDIAAIGAHLVGQGRPATYSEIFTVLKDVELAWLNSHGQTGGRKK